MKKKAKFIKISLFFPTFAERILSARAFCSPPVNLLLPGGEQYFSGNHTAVFVFKDPLACSG